jgi:uncharacterized protein (DUF433 family)
LDEPLNKPLAPHMAAYEPFQFLDMHCIGIVFADGPTGPRARIAGSGIEVWELIATFKGLGESYDKLKKAYDWLSEPQLRSAAVKNPSRLTPYTIEFLV